MTKKRLFLTLTLILWALLPLTAQIPAGYYNGTIGKTGSALKTALHVIIRNHTERSYDNLWDDFEITDQTPTGKVWDMYSNCVFTFVSDQCGTYDVECDCYNREHSFPKSWWGGTTDTMYTDIFHLVPTDGKVNGMRNNFPFGETSSPTYTSQNGSKLGFCSFPGYTGTVFEPIDEYKGDFARNYFYMATRYQNKISSWSSDMLAGNSYPAFTTWALNLLYSWHLQDTVSQKEIDRNNAIYNSVQHNRNPYIDHPEWVAVVWGFTTSSAEINPSEKVHIFPNPAREVLNISGTSEYTFDHVTITDITGRSVMALPMSSSDKTIDVSGLCKGMYFLVLENNGTKITSNFIKE